MTSLQAEALWYLDEHIAKLEAEETKRILAARQALYQQSLNQQSLQTNTIHSNVHSNAFTSTTHGVPAAAAYLSQASAPSSSFSFATDSGRHPSIHAGPSRSNSNTDLPMAAKKRPLDESSEASRPFKRANTGVRPSICVLCNLPFHPVVDCKIMNSDAITMQKRLKQLEAHLGNPEVQPAINALRNQYHRKIKQATRPPMK